jgi:acyl-CoA synthetase (AMP-forming)/AMP-acid ligase II
MISEKTQHKQFRPLVQGFLGSVGRFLDRMVLVVDDQPLTYVSLHRSASNIGKVILDWDEQSSPLVAVFAHRSLTAYANIMGSLLAGKGYVPLNPKLPEERTRKMLCSSQCRTLVVGKEAWGGLARLLHGLEQRLTILLPEVQQAPDFSATFPQHRFLISQDMWRPATSPQAARAGKQH